MTRILRLLLIAAIALPLWQPMAAQEIVTEAVSNFSVAEMNVPYWDISNVGLFNNNHNAPVVKPQVASEPECKHVNKDKTNKSQQVADFSVPIAAKKDQKTPGKKSTKGVSLKADKVTVTPPANAEVEYWNITSTYYYYNNGWQNTSYNNSVKVAIDGNDIYIAGLCVYIEDAWVKGTINGSTVTFPSPQYYGSITQDGETYDFWFVGENSNGNEQNNVSFSYNATIGKLTMTTDHIATKTADTDGSWYGWHESVVITRPLPPDPEFTICNGTVKNEYVPVYGFYFDTQKCESQMIYPAATIKGTGLAAGDQITAITFYVHSDQSNGVVPNQIGTASVEVRIGETTATTIGSYNTMTSNRSGKQTVFSGNLPTGDYKMTITFSQPYTYNGGNLLIDTYVNTKASYAHCYWTGVSATSGSSCYGYPASGWSSSNTFQAQAFLPKMSIEYTTAPIESGLDVAINGEDFFEGKTYTWTDSEGTHENTLADVATKPEQMIAMIQKVYTDPTIPGNLKRGFSSKGRNEPYNDVAYTGVGTIVHDGSSYFNSASHYSWADGYGWGISGNTGNTTHTQYGYDESFMAHYSYMDSTKYKPNENGLTLLLVEIKDDYTLNSYLNKIYNTTYDTPYDMLKAQFAESVKSIRVVKEAKRTGEGVNSGTLFKIDCDKMNKFFLIAKGQMRYLFNSQRVFANFSDPNNTTYYPYATFCRLPLYAKSDYSGLYYDGNEANTSGGFIDENTGELFYHMFEQFSPYDLATQGDNDDLYQDLINMRSFGVKHDCVTVPMASPSGHHFMMYGEDSPSADCQDVRDLMFFIPDYRMMYHSSRDANAKFLNYNPQHMPSMGLYVIHQDEVEEMTKGDTYYKLKLTWDSNMDEFLPGEQQEYQLYEVITDEFGVSQWVPVYKRNDQGQYWNPTTNTWQADTTGAEPIILTFNPNSGKKTYSEVYELREPSSKIVTYAIRGCDTGHFLSLQMSNEQSFLIEGIDPAEMAMLSTATVYSRFEAQEVNNCYSNKLQLKSAPSTIKASYLPNGSTITINRSYAKLEDGAAVTVTEPIATLTVTNSGDNKYFTVSGSVVENQDSIKSLFPKGTGDGLIAGYHANNLPDNKIGYTTSTINGVEYIDFNFSLWDNFVADVSKNEHPGLYTYKMQFTTNGSFDGLNGPTNSAYSNSSSVYVYKTDSRINEPLNQAQVDGDTGCGDECKQKDTEFDAHVMLSSKTEILRYDAYRWSSLEPRSIVIDGGATDEDEEDTDPHGIAGNQGGSYSITMNGIGTDYYYVGDPVSVSTSEPWNWATFVDYYPAKNPDAYVYAPVVELFTRGYQEGSTNKERRDYNTYGGPLKETAAGKLHVAVVNPEVSADVDNPLMSTHTWEVNGNKYAYYNIRLDVDEKTVPTGYQIYKIRAWREIPVSLQGEEYSELSGRMGERVLFEDITYPEYDKDEQYPLGSGRDDVTVVGADNMQHTITCFKGTFGARKLRTTEEAGDQSVISELPYKFVVRIYFTKEGNLNQAQPGAKDGDYVVVTNPDAEFYVAEYEFEGFFDSTNVPTAVQVLNARQVVGEKYYNPAGIESDKPFKGVNIVVTRYSDGSTSTVKVLK